jgi:hypothetical protein
MQLTRIPSGTHDATCGRQALIASTVCAGVVLAILTALTATAVVRIVTGAYGATGDFISFWSAGYIVRTGDGAHLYDPAVQEAVQRAHYAGGFRSADGYIMPVFVAWLFAPFSLIRFTPAFLLYSVFNVGMMFAVARALASYLKELPDMVRTTFLAVFSLSIPTVAVVIFGQVDFITFGAAFAGYVLLRRERYVLAGFAFAFMLFKPQMLVGMILLLIIRRRWSTLAVLGAIGIPLITIPALLTSPHTLISNVAMVSRYSNSNRQLDVNAEMMSNWRGFVVSVTGNADFRVWAPGMVLIALVVLAIAIPRWRSAARAKLPLEQSYALAVLAPLLISWHLHTQSLVLVFLAVALHLKGSFEGRTPSNDDDASQQSRRRAIVMLLTLYSSLFALWFVATIGLALMVFLLLALFWHTAYRWPGREDVRFAELPLAA